MTKRHLWVLLLHLPFPLWSLHTLEGIANTIGIFVAVDDNFHLSFDKRVTRVLVELDISLGLPTEVEILCKDCLFIQKLDYLTFHSGAVTAEIRDISRELVLLSGTRIMDLG